MFDRRSYAVKEHVAVLKLTDTYDIFDAESGTQIGIAKEEIGIVSQLLRLFVNKKLLPTTVVVRESESGPPVMTIHRGMMFLTAKVTVADGQGNELGYFKSKLFSIGGGFYVYDRSGAQSAEVKGDWKSWNFRFLTADGRELGTVSRKWGGMLKELFTSADSYHIQLADDVPTGGALAALLIAAGLAVDIVYKETGN
jgi:uncharacterized protein YxjI